MVLMSDRSELRLALRDPSKLYEHLAGWIDHDRLQIDQLQTANGELTSLFESLLRHHRGEAR